MNRIAAVLFALPFVAASVAACTGHSFEEEQPITPDKLQAPLKGEGFQIKTQLFSVAPGEEIQDCYFFNIRELAKQGGLPENEPVNLNRINIVQRDGSHHMNVFRVKTIVKDAEGKPQLSPELGPIVRGKNGQGACFKSPLWADWPLVANSQQDGAVDWKFPEGVANVFQPDEWIMLQTHYVNAGSQKTPDSAEVAINWHTIPKEQVKHEMGTLFATKQSIRVCKSNPTPEFTGSCQFKNTKEPINIIGANAHFHGRGRVFEMYSWDGLTTSKPDPSARFYRSETWDDPPMLRSPELDLKVQPNGGVFFAAQYQWTPPAEEMGGCKALDDYDKSPNKDCCYTFGPVVEKNEHCNIFVYYWPKQEAGNVFCN
jgi:hypothetical protein